MCQRHNLSWRMYYYAQIAHNAQLLTFHIDDANLDHDVDWLF